MSKKNIVILGGGFAGTTLAASLEKKLHKDWEIYLLNNTNSITYHPLLPEVVGASVLPSHVQTPIRHMLKRTRIRMVTIDRVDFKKRLVHYHNNTQGQLHFDQLVIASGVDANLSMLDGLEEHALPLKTVGDALTIRNRMIERLEQATIHPDEEVRKELTKFIVIGGGFSGVEVAGEMEDFLISAQRFYKNVRREDCKVILLHAMDRLLPELSPKLGLSAEKEFRKRGIDVQLDTMVSSVGKNYVELWNGSRIKGSIIVCTVGTQAKVANLCSDLPLNRGKIITETNMQVKDLDGVWALGDCALVMNAYDGNFCPATAQFADRQAKLLAKNIVANIREQPTHAFSYKPIGMLAAIGHNKAVAEIYGIRISGFIAFLMWRSVYLLKVPTFTRKMRLFLEWTWSLVFPADVAHLGFKRTNEE